MSSQTLSLTDTVGTAVRRVILGWDMSDIVDPNMKAAYQVGEAFSVDSAPMRHLSPRRNLLVSVTDATCTTNSPQSLVLDKAS